MGFNLSRMGLGYLARSAASQHGLLLDPEWLQQAQSLGDEVDNAIIRLNTIL
jgi:hypothetical protein